MDNLPVNITDIAVVVVLLVSAFLAYVRGLVREVLSVAGWIGGGLIAIYAFPYAKPFARDLISIEPAADLAAAIAVFVISLAILSILTSAISKRVQNSELNALDRSLGFLFGLARGGILVSLFYIIIEWMMPIVDQPAWLRSARTIPLIESSAQQLRSLFPEDAVAAADTAAAQTNKLIESKKVIEGMISPEPKSSNTGTLEGYGRKIRNEMERLIDSSSQQ
jgi:membrane protein required for colicin V production